MRELASKVGASIEELATGAKLNTQTLYRKPLDSKFSRKATVEMIEAANRIAVKNQVKSSA